MARKRPGLVAIRRVAGWVTVFLGLFLVFFGFGYGNQWVSLGGGAVALLAGAFRVATRLRGSARQWVVGTGQVASVSDPPPSAPYGRCELQLVVDAPGMPREIVVIREPRVPVGQWPHVGQDLPIEVAADDIRNVRVLWPDRPREEAEGEEDEGDPMWGDDQPAPAPAAPPRSHLDRPDIDFDLDGPPTIHLESPAAGDLSPEDEGWADHHAVAEQATASRVPRPRPRPRPRPAPRSEATLEPDPARPATDVLAIYPSAHPVPSGAIHRLGVALQVADLERSLTFYRDLLGFHLVDRSEESVVLASGEHRLVLRALVGMAPVQRRVVYLNLDVADLDEVYTQLRAAGVRFTSPPRLVSRGARSEQRAAVFKDPDGHGLALTEWRAVPV